MATTTYKQVANIKLTSAAASITFSSITQEYADLIFVFDGSLSANSSIDVIFNSETGYTVPFVYLSQQLGAAPTVANGSAAYLTTRSNFGTGKNAITFNISDYSSTNKYKSIFHHEGRNTTQSANTIMFSSFNSLTAITSIKLKPTSVGKTFNIGSSFSIYGIVK